MDIHCFFLMERKRYSCANIIKVENFDTFIGRAKTLQMPAEGLMAIKEQREFEINARLNLTALEKK